MRRVWQWAATMRRAMRARGPTAASTRGAWRTARTPRTRRSRSMRRTRRTRRIRRTRRTRRIRRIRRTRRTLRIPRLTTTRSRVSMHVTTGSAGGDDFFEPSSQNGRDERLNSFIESFVRRESVSMAMSIIIFINSLLCMYVRIYNLTIFAPSTPRFFGGRRSKKNGKVNGSFRSGIIIIFFPIVVHVSFLTYGESTSAYIFITFAILYITPTGLDLASLTSLISGSVCDATKETIRLGERDTTERCRARGAAAAYSSDRCAGVGAGAGAGAAGGAGGTSEYVRNELRAVVGARVGRPDLHAPDLDPLLTFDMPAPG